MAESQVTPMDIEISNERAAELTAAREQVARLTASISELRNHITWLEAGIAAAVRGHMFYHDEYGASIPLEALRTQLEQVEAHLYPRTRAVNAPQPVTRPFTGQGHRLDEDGSDEDGPYCPSMAHDWDGDVCKACGTTRERWDSAPPPCMP